MEEIRCGTAAEFLAALDPGVAPWIDGDPLSSPWIFRGHASAAWGLVPCAWREEAAPLLSLFLRAAEKIKVWKKSDPTEQARFGPDEVRRKVLCTRYAERALVRMFANLADEVGLTIPRANLADIPSIQDLSSASPWWPNPREPITALAQHHGIPTRLLDCTRNPLYAAFFAAEEEEPGAEALAVVALSTSALRATQAEVVTCPRAENSYLHAQDGVFLLRSDADVQYQHGLRWPSLEDAVEPSGLLKYVLPVEQRRELLRLLLRRRISRGHLMPTYSEVARAALTKVRLLR